jgi:hypothetical protein
MRNGSSFLELDQHILFPPAPCDAPKISIGSDFTYDLYCGAASDPECPVNWKEVTFVFINNLKWSEVSNQKVSLFLKENLPVGARILSLKSLPFWEIPTTSGERLTRKKSRSEGSFKSIHNPESDVIERLNIAMPVQRFRSREYSFSWNPEAIDFYVHQVQT